MWKWIRVSEKVHRRLLELGRKDETFDALLDRILPQPNSGQGAER